MPHPELNEKNRSFTLTSEEVENIFNAVSLAEGRLSTGTAPETVFKWLMEDVKFIIFENDTAKLKANK